MKKKKQKNIKSKIFTRFVSATLIAALSVNGYYAYNLFGGDIAKASSYKGKNSEQIELQQERDAKKKAEEKAEAVSYIPPLFSNNIDMVIVDEDDAEKLFSEIRYEMNLFDIGDTFPFSYFRSNKYFDVYTMQQYHNGIEVYGHEIKMTADKAGRLLSVNGNPAKLKDFDTTVTLSENEAYEYAEKYLKSEYQLTDDDVTIKSRGKKIGFDENNEPVMGYLFDYTPGNSSEPTGCILIEGNKGKIISDMSYFSRDMTEIDLEGQQVNQTLWISEDGDEYRLEDTDRRIRVIKGSNTNRNGVYTWNRDESSPNKSGVDALANLQRIYDFYRDVFDRIGIHNNSENWLDVFVDVGDINMWSNAQMRESGNTIEFGTNFFMTTKAAYLDVVAHEYGHGIVFTESGISASESLYSQSSAINEGLADIFGELAEDYCDDRLLNGTCNWIHGTSRNIANPTDEKNENILLETKAVYNATDWASDECHNASYITSYSAYLMTQGINGTEALTNEELAKLYYNSLNQLNGGCTFTELRSVIMNTASEMCNNGDLSVNKLETIMDAFDRVGIDDGITSLTKDATLYIYDENNKLYKNSELIIYQMSGLDKEEYVTDVRVENGTFHLANDLQPGIYIGYVKDMDEPDNYKSFTFAVNDNVNDQLVQDYENRYNILTNFGTPNKEVALVLDVSYSMEGEPIAQTKQAALNFVETVFEANPNINVTLITFADDATLRLESCNNEAQLCGTIMGLDIESGTRMIEALSIAEGILDENDVDNKYIIFMSDGVSGDSPEQVADSIKDNDIILCSLGFYHSSSDGAGVMSDIASPGYYYNVKNATDIQGVFDEIARQVSGEVYDIIEIECPVDVVVSYDGETLSSAAEKQNLRTSFGSITFEGEDNEKKVLRLNRKADYEICIYGTGKGTMDYTVSYADDNGKYSDVRKFKKIPIRKNTIISTQSSKVKETILKVDKDGDGKFDVQYSGTNKRKGSVQPDDFWRKAFIMPIIIFALWIVLEIILLVIRIKHKRVCDICGAELPRRKIEFCSKCGNSLNKNNETHMWGVPFRGKRTVFILKTTLAAVCVLITVGTTFMYRSAANTIYLQIRNSDFVSARMMYNKNIEDKEIPRFYLSAVTDIYLKKVEKAQNKGKISDVEAEDIYQAVASMDMGKASDNAKTKLETISVQE